MRIAARKQQCVLANSGEGVYNRSVNATGPPIAR